MRPLRILFSLPELLMKHFKTITVIHVSSINLNKTTMAILRDYVPTADVDFFNLEVNLITLATANAVAWVIPTGVGTSFLALTTEQGTYTPLYNKITNKNNRTKSDVTAHRQARIHFEKTLRQFVGEFL